MARKTKNVIARARAAARETPSPVGIIVRRGALRRFDAFTRKTVNLPVVVSWDRRLRDEPAGTNQPKRERRRKPPYTWEVGDFVVVDSPPTIVERAKRQSARNKNGRPDRKKQAKSK